MAGLPQLQKQQQHYIITKLPITYKIVFVFTCLKLCVSPIQKQEQLQQQQKYLSIWLMLVEEVEKKITHSYVYK